ncbi:hypothetical protein DPEC_G00180960 [Dallia pectoralis]|uniref:Uncharacterized protein n=1 Tax=Dallia pectoralis TaxID=75939 RepID=A0ACC2GA45_DALPE|nr:hypothetical protein DPEC_G00180960 [Dallia pectoralis]
MGNVSMLVVCVAVIFSLVSVSQTAPVSHTCEELLKPLEMKTIDPMIGKWSFIAMSTDRPGIRTFTDLFVENIWWDFTPGASSNSLNAKKHVKLMEECYSKQSNFTLEKNIWTISDNNAHFTAVLLPTCSDCMVTMTRSSIKGNVYTNLKLLSKRRELSKAELLEFDRQIECLKLPSRFSYTIEEELCPDTSPPFPEMDDFWQAQKDFLEIDVVKKILRA